MRGRRKLTVMGEKVIYGSQNLTFVLKKKSLYYF